MFYKPNMQGDNKTGQSLIKNFPFSYYNSQVSNECFQIAEESNKKNEKVGMSLKDRMESQIKNKYNLIIPAVLIELQDQGKNTILLEKEDLKNLLTSLGAIKHIEINSNHAYVLYEHYLSALIAYNILNNIITMENRTLITVKLFTKEEDEEKQRRINNQNNLKKSIPENIKNKKNSKDLSDNSFRTKIGSPIKNQNKNNLITDSYFSGNLNSEFSFLKAKEESKESKSESFNKNISSRSIISPTRKELEEKVRDHNFTEYDPKYLPWNYSNQINPVNNNTDQHLNVIKTTFSDFPADFRFPTNYPYNCKIIYNQFYMLKFVCNYDIQIENDQNFKVTKRLIGNKGLVLRKILFDSCIKNGDHTTKIRLRGKGSGYKEGVNNTESEDPLQLCISSLNHYTYSKCLVSVEILLKDIYSDHYNYLLENNRLTEASLKKIVKYDFVVNRY